MLLLMQHCAMTIRQKPHVTLSRRERQIMDILYQRERATAAEVHADLPDRPSYSAVRAKLRVLEEKGHIRHEEEALRYVFLPTMAREKAKRSALNHMLETFFEGSVEQTVAALLDLSAAKLSQSELDRLAGLIEQAKAKGDWK
jgi:BlaI family penicillinase repressor